MERCWFIFYMCAKPVCPLWCIICCWCWGWFPPLTTPAPWIWGWPTGRMTEGGGTWVGRPGTTPGGGPFRIIAGACWVLTTTPCWWMFFMCVFRCDFCLNSLAQRAQLCLLSPCPCTPTMCLPRLPLRLNCLKQTLQSYRVPWCSACTCMSRPPVDLFDK